MVITFPNQQTLTLPANTIAAIAESQAKYAAPLWHSRAERVLKLGAHQWIDPLDIELAQTRFAQQPSGVLCYAWKLFTRDWLAYADAYFADTFTYPNQPRHLGRNVIPLVDEDNDSRQIGWVRIEQVTPIDANFTVFVQFTLLDLFTPRNLPVEYS